MADYLAGYGPEVWQLTYGMKQAEQKSGYWETRVLPPTYLQFWPPEKKQPRTLVEFDYPPENAPPSLLEMLRQKDPRLEQIRNSDPQMAMVVTGLLQGRKHEIIRGGYHAISSRRPGGNCRAELPANHVHDRNGKGLRVDSSAPDRSCTTQRATSQRHGQQGERPADAPSLLKH